MPAAAGDDHGTLAVPDALGLGDRRVGQLALDRATVGVDLLELCGEGRGLGHVVGEQDAEGHVRLAHAAGRVEAGHERERQSVSRDGREVAARRRGQGHDARARGRAHAGDTVGNQGTVLPLQEHHIRDGAEAGEVREAAPEVGHAEAEAQLADDLESDADTGELARGTSRIELGIADGHALRHQVGRLMMIGDHDVDAAGKQAFDLMGGGDAVVHRHDEVGMAGIDHTDECSLGKAVALRKTVGNEGIDIGTQLAQAEGEQGRGGHTVHVEIAEDRDRLAQPDGALQAVGGLAQAGDAEGVAPVALKRGREECARCIGIRDAAGNEDPRYQRRDPELGGKAAAFALIPFEYLPPFAADQPRHDYLSLPAMASSTGAALVFPYFASSLAHLGSRVFHIASSGEATAKLE